jgi:FSR family fosmidomycin resistance protein-like MFS transporter
VKRRPIVLLAAAHLCDDVNQGVIPALIPFFVSDRGFTIAAAAGLVFASNVSSSVLQPLFGMLADRRSTPWLVPAGLLLAGTGVACAGLAPTYALVLACVGATGVGVAAFHPEAARQIYVQSGSRRATAMSWFATGGNLGFAVGPAIATPIQIAFGLRGTLLLVAPVVAMAAILVRAGFLRPAPVPVTPAGPASARDDWGAFGRLSAPVLCRAVVFYALNTFVPLYWIREFGSSKAAGGVALTVMLGSGVAGTLFGGWLADRIGRRVVVLGSMLLLTPLLAGFAACRQPLPALLLMVPIGIALYAPFSVMTVMGQEYLPGRVGTASGLTIGLAVTLGGLAAPVLGRLADLRGVRFAVVSVVLVPLLGAAVALTLPRERGRGEGVEGGGRTQTPTG